MSNKKKELRPIGWWLKEYLPSPIQEKAIKYAEAYGTTSIRVGDLTEAIKRAFVWGHTREGEKKPGYWSRISKEYCPTQKNK